MASKVAIIADLHFGMRNDSEIFDNYIHKFFSDIFFPYLEKNDIKYIIIAGDVFDRRKFINFRILNRFRTQFIQRIIRDNYRVFVIPGNHDAHTKTNLTINSLRELLGDITNFHLFEEPGTIDIGKMKFSFLPWICEENREECIRFIENDKEGEILIAHLELNGFKPYRNSMPFEAGLDGNMFSKYDAVFTGHFHHKSSRENIHYVGSVCEIISSDAGDHRGFHVLDTETRDLEFIPNPLKIFSMVNYDDRDRKLNDVLNDLTPVSQYANTFVRINVLNKTNPFYFDKFLELLKSAGLHDYNVSENIQQFESELDEMTVKDTTALLHEYVNELDTSLEKEKLSNILMELYVTATQMDQTIW